MIDELRSIGLSDLEARIYLALHESPEMSGYEVAKRVSVSRSNVYAALRAMTDKGCAERSRRIPCYMMRCRSVRW